jgi:hypothetical protein
VMAMLVWHDVEYFLRTVVRVSNVGHFAEANVYVSLERGGVVGI